jgi:hypothetical protein
MLVICINQIGRFLIAAIVALMPAATIAADSRDPATPAPHGWTVYSAGSPGGAALRCASYSKREWSVSLDGDTPLISSVRTSRQRMTAIAFENGRLAGYDNGPFGGGLWWVGADRSVTMISRAHVRGLVHTTFGTLVLVGLDHWPMRSGQVLRLVPETPYPPSMTMLADLGETPQAFALSSDGAVVVVTGTRVLRINPPGTIETLFSTNYIILQPNSVAVSSDGTIYVGMRYFVTRLALVKQSYEEDWLVPEDCVRFEQQEHSCRCLDQSR